MSDAADKAARSARELARRTGVDHHDVLVILGTGLAGTAQLLGCSADQTIPLATLPFFPRYTATHHQAHGWSVPLGGKQVLVFAGRCHAYEGVELAEVVHPLRTGVAAGCSAVILTAAVGAIAPDLPAGSVVVVDDQINLTGHTPLVGPEHVDMVDAYSPGLRSLALATPGIPTPRPGTYVQVNGPQFETPAEVAMLRAMGADVVGMSMALETIAARRAGADVLGLAVVTNEAAGSSGGIEAAAGAAVPDVARIIRHVVESSA